jgi:catechol 2,3-dioxygenase-like lactoylglutathione lyase family enzyme
MTVHFDHTIVPAHDKRAAAEFLAGILGLEVSAPFGPFIPVETANGVKLDFADADKVDGRHYAFLVSDEDFDAIFARIEAGGIDFFADPYHERAGEFNHRDGGRGFYFSDPNGHNLEIITREYGSGGPATSEA